MLLLFEDVPLIISVYKIHDLFKFNKYFNSFYFLEFSLSLGVTCFVKDIIFDTTNYKLLELEGRRPLTPRGLPENRRQIVSTCLTKV